MTRVVIDTNSFLVSIPKRSEFRPIFDAIIDGKIRLLISNEILLEYAEIFEQKMNSVVSINVVEFLSQSNHTEKIDIYYQWHLINQDADDNKFVDCAVSGNADYIVTDDKHFKELEGVKFPAISVLRTEQFLLFVNDLKK